MKNKFDPLERVGEAFEANYRAGGIDACRNMVNDLFVISEAAKVFIDAADTIDEEAVTSIGSSGGINELFTNSTEAAAERTVRPTGAAGNINLETALELTEELTTEAERAVSEYRHADFLLRIME